MVRNLIHLLLPLLALSVQGQVIVDRSVVLDGPTTEQRQVTGLMPGTVANWPITAGMEQSGAHRTASAGIDWHLDLPALTGPPSPGTHLVVQVPDQPGVGPVQLMVNLNGPYPVLLAPGSPLLAESIAGSPVLSLVFDGGAFQAMNGRARLLRTCPGDMIAVNEQSCVDISESDTSNFFIAGRDCITQNKRLCSWGEWYGACTQAATLGLQNMNDNWEWTNNTANEDNSVRIVGPGCGTAAAWTVFNAPQHYRCCYTR